jgi:HPt (histidine-containing phosphotransfer) domain-containing protein
VSRRRDRAARAQGPVGPGEVDLDVLRSLRDELGGMTVLRGLVELYLRRLPEQRALVAGGMAGVEPAAVALTAHTLRSSSATLGLSVLADRCARLQRQPDDRDLGAEVLAAIDRAPDGLAAAMDTLAGGDGTDPRA